MGEIQKVDPAPILLGGLRAGCWNSTPEALIGKENEEKVKEFAKEEREDGILYRSILRK